MSITTKKNRRTNESDEGKEENLPWNFLTKWVESKVLQIVLETQETSKEQDERCRFGIDIPIILKICGVIKGLGKRGGFLA